MLHLNSPRNIADLDIDLEEPLAAEQFEEVLARLNLDYDLPPDVLAEAEVVLQAMRATEKN
jgi:hypothetical protein